MPYYVENYNRKYLKDFNCLEYTLTSRRADALAHETKAKAEQSLKLASQSHRELRLLIKFEPYDSDHPEP